MSNNFSLHYSASQQNEVRKIRDKYNSLSSNGRTNTVQNSYERIKALDASTTKNGTIVSLVVGIISSLILGTGMRCIMMWDMMIIGLLVGIIGLVGCICAYPIYASMVRSARVKVQSEILSLCEDELRVSAQQDE